MPFQERKMNIDFKTECCIDDDGTLDVPNYKGNCYYCRDTTKKQRYEHECNFGITLWVIHSSKYNHAALLADIKKRPDKYSYMTILLNC